MRTITSTLVTIGAIAALAAAVALPPATAFAAFQPAPPVDRDGRHGTPQYDGATDVGVDAAGNVYQVIGTDGTFPGEASAGGRDQAVAKFAPDGTHLWTTQIGTTGTDNDGGEIAVTSSGLVGIAGNTTAAFPGFTFLGGFYDAFFVILDTDGNVTFTDQFGTSSWDEATGVYTDGTSFHVTGFTDGTLPGQTSAGGRDGFVRRYDTVGNVTGETQFGTSGSDNAGAVAAAGDGTVYVTGFTGGSFSTPVGGNDGFVAKFAAADLAFVAGVNLGTTANDNYRGIGVSAAGNVVVTGSTFGAIPGQTPDGWDIIVQGVDGATLASRWIRQFGLTSNFDNGADVTVAADGTSYTACSTYGLEDLGAVGNEHGCVIVLDDLGGDLWNDQFIGVGASLAVSGSALDPDGGVWLAGRTAGTFGGPTVGDQDAIRRKYAPFAGSVTDVTACGFVADAPGDYRVAGPVSGGGVCIDVTASGVVLDLNGQTITSIDDGTDAPGTGIRFGPGLTGDIVNQGVGPAEILVDSAGGVGIDLNAAVGVTVDGGPQRIGIRLTPAGDGKTGVDATGSTSTGLASVDGQDETADGVGVRADATSNFTYSDGYWAHEESLAMQRALIAAGVDVFGLEDIDSDGGGVRVEGSGLDIRNLNLTPGVATGTPYLEVEGDGDVLGLFVAPRPATANPGPDDVLASFVGSAFDPNGTVRLDTPRFEGFRARVAFGDNVEVRDPVFIAGGLDARLFVDATSFPPTFTGLLFRSTDPSHDLAVEFAPGASATFDDNVTFETYTADGLNLVGSVGTFGASMSYGSGVRYDPFVADHVARVDNGLVPQADEVFFFPAGMAAGDKVTFVDGVPETACVSEPDGLSVTCPTRNGTYTFGHEINDVGCGAVYDVADRVVLQDRDLTAPGGTTCVEVAAGNVTYDMLDRRIRAEAGSPGAETRAIAITGAGATIREGSVDLGGTDTIGVDVEADDTTLRAMTYGYEYDRTIGVRARTRPIRNLTVIDESHIGTGAGAGVRTAWTVDGAGNLVVARSVGGDAFHTYDFRWTIENSEGTITDAHWIGGISASGAGVDAELVVVDSVWDARGGGRELSFGDDFTYRRGRLYTNADGTIGNRAAARGPRLESTELYTYDNRPTDLIEDNPAAPVTVVDTLGIVTERDGVAYGRTVFPPTIPDTDESGFTSRYAYDDRDSNRVGDDLPAVPRRLEYDRMTTPAGLSTARLIIDGTGEDAIANGGCTVTSATGTPVELDCDPDLGTGTVAERTVHWTVCGDGVRNEQVAGDACDPGPNPTSGKCQANCTIVPAPGALQITLDRDPVDPEGVVLTWNDTGEGPYRVYRSTDPADVVDPANGIGLTSGTTWTDLPPAGGPYHYAVGPDL